MERVETDVRRAGRVLLAIGVLLACGQVVAPVRLWADAADLKDRIDSLIVQLTRDDPAAARKAYFELSKMGAPAAAKLIPLLRHPKPDARRNVASLLVRMTRQDAASRGVLAGACPALVAALADKSISLPVALVLMEVGPPAAKHLIPALRHTNKQVRVSAAHALAGLFDKPNAPRSASAGAIAPLTAMTRDDDRIARAYAYLALAVIDSRRRVETLLQAFADPDPMVAQHAASYIAAHAHRPEAKQLKDKRLIEALTAAKKSSDSRLSDTAGRALQWLQDPKAAEDALRRRHAQPPPSGVPGADAGMAAGLARRIPSLSLGRTKLEDALQFIRELSRLNIVADWRALEKFGVASFTSVTVTASKVSVSDALRLILTDVDKAKTRVRFEGIDGVVVISTTEGLAAIRKARQFEQTRRRLAGTADRAVWKKLDGGPPEIHFKDVPLKDAMAFFSQVCGVRFEMNWKAFGALGAYETSRFTLRLRGASTATALWVMFLKFDKARDLAVTVRNGAVTLAKPGSVPTSPPAGNARPTPPPKKPTPPRRPSPPKPPPDAETAAAKMLCLAALYQTNKKTDKAIELYRKIVRQYPNTKAADKARAHLAVLDNR